MAAQPYIGITGIINVYEAKQVCRIFAAHNLNNEEQYTGMMGVLVCDGTLQGKRIPGNRYPDLSVIPDILAAADPQVLKILHLNLKDKTTLYSTVEAYMEYEGIYRKELVDGIQYNIHWPHASELAAIRAAYPRLKNVLQVSGRSIRRTAPAEIVQRLQEYRMVIDYVLIDPSGGMGEDCLQDECITLAETVHRELPELTIVMAGGFAADNVAARLQELTAFLDFPFAIDAEGRLRDKRSDEYHDDVLNIEKAAEYVHQAYTGIRK